MGQHAIFFDCDGTLVDSEQINYEAWSYAVSLFGGSLSKESYYAQIGKSVPTMAKELANQLQLSSHDELLDHSRKQVFVLQERGIVPITGTVSFLNRAYLLKKNYNLHLGVTSASFKKNILSYLQKLEIEHFFDLVLSGEEDLTDYSDPEGVNKPKPYIYMHAAKLLGLTPQQCIAIEDSYSGVLSAKQAGCFTIAVPTIHTKNHNFSIADLVLECLNSVSIEEILAYL